jgi:putative ABC transport system permease protein
MSSAARRIGAEPPAWISEAIVDIYGVRPGEILDLPLAGRSVPFRIAGVWRDYARSSGAVAVSRVDYVRLTGDADASEASLWLKPGTDPASSQRSVRSVLGGARAVDILTSTELRDRSLRIFDRAFAITYALELLAILIGLAGVSVAASSTALSRRAEFGMLRHIGMTRGQITRMLAVEGVVISALGVLYGLCLGIVLSLVLVFVINRRSFHWSIDFSVPGAELAVLAAVLIGTAALMAVWSGRIATQGSALAAVREDW